MVQITEDLIKAYIFKNAICNKGIPNSKAVMKSLVGHHKALKTADGDSIANGLIEELKNANNRR